LSKDCTTYRFSKACNSKKMPEVFEAGFLSVCGRAKEGEGVIRGLRIPEPPPNDFPLADGS
jgi:hypothetical protein